MGVHLEGVDNRPPLLVSPRGSGGGAKRSAPGGARASDDVADLRVELERVSVAASSLAKVCRALLLSHPTVLAAVAAAQNAGVSSFDS